MRFMVSASREISSSPDGVGTRRWSWAADISSTSVRIASTGANARPTTFQVMAATSSTMSGIPTASSRVTVCVESATVSMVRATTTTSWPSVVSAPWAVARKSVSSTGTVITLDSPGLRRTTGGSPSTLWLDATTRPSGATTCTSMSSLSSMARLPVPLPDSIPATTSMARRSTAFSMASVRFARRIATRRRAPTTMARPTTTVAATVVRTLTVASRAFTAQPGLWSRRGHASGLSR